MFGYATLCHYIGNMKKQRVNITIDEQLVPKIDDKRIATGHTRSSFINYVLNLFFREEEEKREKKEENK